MSELTNQTDTDEQNSVHSASSDDQSDAPTEYTEVNLQDEKLYQVLSTFFETTNDGVNITDILSNINDNIKFQNKILANIANSFSNLQFTTDDDTTTGGDDDTTTGGDDDTTTGGDEDDVTNDGDDDGDGDGNDNSEETQKADDNSDSDDE